MTRIAIAVRLGLVGGVIASVSAALPTDLHAAVAWLRMVCLVGGAYLLTLAALHLAVACSPRRIRPALERLRLPGHRLVAGIAVSASTVAMFDTPSVLAIEDPADTARLVVLDDDPAPETPPSPEAADTVAPAPAPPVANTWTVDAGEHFWQIAADHLESINGTPPTDTEIDLYWRALIDANHNRLVDPDNPDLILPGQVFELPPA